MTDAPAKQYPDNSEIFARLERRGELHRLQTAVVSAAKEWANNEDQKDEDGTELKLALATTALLEFEAAHSIEGEKK